MDREGKAYVQGENSIRMTTGPDFQDDDVEQPSGLELIDVAKGKPTEGGIGSECSRLDQEEGKAVSNNLKPKFTWTRIIRMDFWLGRLSKALMLPTRGKRSNDSNLEEGKREVIDTREAKRGRVGSRDDLDNTILAGVESYPCWEQ